MDRISLYKLYTFIADYNFSYYVLKADFENMHKTAQFYKLIAESIVEDVEENFY